MCDPDFAGRFLKACDLDCADLEVTSAVAEPSLGGEGFSISWSRACLATAGWLS